MTRIGVTGHQVLPEGVEEYVVLRLKALIPQNCAMRSVAVSSLAAGADQIFARYMLQMGAQLVVVVPCSNYERSFTSLGTLANYSNMLRQASEVEQMVFDEPSEQAFMAAGRRVVERSQWLVAVWDGRPSRGHGGTADVVAYAHDLGKRVEIIWPPGVHR